MAITVMKKPYKAKEVENILNPTVRKWFFSRFKAFSLPQLYGVMEIHMRKNILVSAPTGATKHGRSMPGINPHQERQPSRCHGPGGRLIRHRENLSD